MDAAAVAAVRDFSRVMQQVILLSPLSLSSVRNHQARVCSPLAQMDGHTKPVRYDEPFARFRRAIGNNKLVEAERANLVALQ